jgi:hypothetical protein
VFFELFHQSLERCTGESVFGRFLLFPDDRVFFLLPAGFFLCFSRLIPGTFVLVCTLGILDDQTVLPRKSSLSSMDIRSCEGITATTGIHGQDVISSSLSKKVLSFFIRDFFSREAFFSVIIYW